MIQSSSQRGVRHLIKLQLPQYVLPIRTCHTGRHNKTSGCRNIRAFVFRAESQCEARVVLPGLSKVNISPSHLAALLGVLGSELQLDLRRLFLFGEMGSSVEESKSAHKNHRRHLSITQAHYLTLNSLFLRLSPFEFFLFLR